MRPGSAIRSLSSTSIPAKLTEVGPFFRSQYDFFSTQAVTDQGVGCSSISVSTWGVPDDRPRRQCLVRGARIDGCESWPHVSRTSEDGRYWVGYVTQRKGFYRPVLWTDGVPELLPMPEKNYRDEDFTTGILDAASPTTAASSTAVRGRTPISAWSTGNG